MQDSIQGEDDENHSLLNNTAEDCEVFISSNQGSHCTNHLFDQGSLCFNRKVEVSSNNYEHVAKNI